MYRVVLDEQIIVGIGSDDVRCFISAAGFFDFDYRNEHG